MAPVLPLLRRNYENNLSPAALRGEGRLTRGKRSRSRTGAEGAAGGRGVGGILRGPGRGTLPHTALPPSPPCPPAASGDGHHAEAAGRVAVAELDWAQPAHFTGGGEGGKGVVVPPFDIILAADCICERAGGVGGGRRRGLRLARQEQAPARAAAPAPNPSRRPASTPPTPDSGHSPPPLTRHQTTRPSCATCTARCWRSQTTAPPSS
jgi:hypothetical protein